MTLTPDDIRAIAQEVAWSIQPELLRDVDVAQRLKIAKSTVRELVKSGILPKPIRWGTTVRWRSTDVTAMINQLKDTGGIS